MEQMLSLTSHGVGSNPASFQINIYKDNKKN